MFRKRTLQTIIPIIIVLLAVSMVFAGKEREFKEKLISRVEQASIDLSAGTKVIFPSGCLSENTWVRLERITSSEKVAFCFEPHGLKFLKPVEIHLSWASLANVEAEDLILYYWDNKKGEWVEETRAIWKNDSKHCEFHINHFSYYYYLRR